MGQHHLHRRISFRGHGLKLLHSALRFNLVWFLHSDSPFLGKRKLLLAYQGCERRVATFYDLPGIPDLPNSSPFSDQLRSNLRLISIELARSTEAHATLFGRIAPSLGPLANQIPLELGNAGENGHNHLAGVSCRVGPRCRLKWPPLSRPFFDRNKLRIGGSDLRSGAAEAAPPIPALESALRPHSCVALSSAQVPLL